MNDAAKFAARTPFKYPTIDTHQSKIISPKSMRNDGWTVSKEPRYAVMASAFCCDLIG